MIALIQRVTQAKIVINDKVAGEISQGILALIGIEKTDSSQNIPKLVDKLINYRIFADSEDKMNLSVKTINGSILLIPQFTLAANTQKGLRPSFSSSASPEIAKDLFSQFIQQMKNKYRFIETGIFGADMQVSLVNDGPVTFILKS